MSRLIDIRIGDISEYLLFFKDEDELEEYKTVDYVDYDLTIHGTQDKLTFPCFATVVETSGSYVCGLLIITLADIVKLRHRFVEKSDE